MFKKRSKPSKEKTRRRAAASDDEEEEDRDGEAVTDALQTVKKRRTLLTALQYKRGTDATQLLLQGRPDDTATTMVVAATDANNTSGEKDGASDVLSTNTKRSEQQVWKERHNAAMEEFIQQRMSNDGDKPEAETKKTKSHKDELYQNLAVTAAELSGKTASATETKASTTEVVRSGAATAMAEVILPSSSSSQQQQRASSKPPRRPNRPVGVPQEKEEGDASDDRLGFAASRGQRPQEPRQQSSDDRAFSKFVQRQRR